MIPWSGWKRWLGLCACVLGVSFTLAGGDPRVTWGIDVLEDALASAGYDPTEIAIEWSVDPETDLIPAKERYGESYVLKMDGDRVQITGVDPAGVLYGCLDAAVRLQGEGELPSGVVAIESPTMSLRGPCVLLMKLGAYNFAVSPEEFPFFYDREMWLRWLDFIAEQRFNTLTFWNGHPFAYFVPFDRYSEAQDGMEAGLVERNREMLHWLVEEGQKRNISFVFQFYNIHTSVYFQEAHELPDEVSEPTKLLSDYTSYAVERFVSEFPEIGLHITPGEALALEWTDQWVNDVLYPAIEKGGIQAPVIVRSWGLDLPHAQKIADVHPETWFERKFGVEMIPDTRADPENREWANLTGRHIVNIHMAANLEPFRWSPPEYVRQCVLASLQTGARGIHLYPRKSWRWPMGSEPGNPQLQWERDRMWYETWARYAWKADRDPGADRAWWIDRLSREFGDRTAAAKLLESMEVGADVLPLIQRLIWLGNDNHSVVTAGIRLSQLESAGGIPYLDLPDVGQRIPEFLDSVRAGQEPIPPTPVDALEEAFANAERAAELATEAFGHAQRRRTEMAAWVRDAEAVRLTAQFYLERMKAADLKARLDQPDARVKPDAFLAELEQSLDTYLELVTLTAGHYDSLSDVPMWNPVRLKKVPYHWADVVPLYRREIEMYRSFYEGGDEEPSSDPVHEGWIGILYSDPGLKRPREGDLATHLDLDWAAAAADRGKNWSEEWRGLLLPPDGVKLALEIESDQAVQLSVEGEVLIAFSQGAGTYRVSVSDDLDAPVSVRLAYDHRRGLTGRLHVRWSLDGGPFVSIPADALRHSDRERRWVDQALFLSEL